MKESQCATALTMLSASRAFQNSSLRREPRTWPESRFLGVFPGGLNMAQKQRQARFNNELLLAVCRKERLVASTSWCRAEVLCSLLRTSAWMPAGVRSAKPEMKNNLIWAQPKCARSEFNDTFQQTTCYGLHFSSKLTELSAIKTDSDASKCTTIRQPASSCQFCPHGKQQGPHRRVRG